MYTIMIADDNIQSRKVLASKLAGEYNIVFADNGMQAIDIMNNSSLVCILMNFEITGINGFEVLDFMKSRGYYEYIPVILICSSNDRAYIKKGYEAGIADKIHRPFNNIIIKKRINNVVRLYLQKKQLLDNNTNMKNALDKVNNALKSRTTFLNSMSHDIRTPMLTIIGMAELAKDNLENNKSKAIQCLDRAAIASDHLIKLINDILDMSRIDNNKMLFHLEKCCLSDVVTEAITIVQQQIKQKGVLLSLNTKDVVHENIMTDTTRLKQVIINLLGTFIKNVKDDEMLSLEITECESAKALFARYHFKFREVVSDDFEFIPLMNSKVDVINKEYLPIYITKYIVEKMEGSIHVSAPEKSILQIDVFVNLRIDESAEKNEVFFDGINVLVADDSKEITSSIANYLSNIGINVVQENDAYAAIETCKREAEKNRYFDIIIADVVMDYMSGFSLAQKIRDISKNHSKVFIMSAYDINDMAEDKERYLIDGLVTKPVFASNLMKILDNVYMINTEEEHYQKKKKFSDKKVLVVDDNAVNRMIACDMLEDIDIKADEAFDGMNAVEIITNSGENAYDIIFMDIKMPGIDGYETTKMIRKCGLEYALKVPIVAMSAETYDIEKFKESEMNYYLVKPTEFEALCNTVSQIFKG